MPRELKSLLSFNMPSIVCQQMEDARAELRESRSEFLREAVLLRLDLIRRDKLDREATNG